MRPDTLTRKLTAIERRIVKRLKADEMYAIKRGLNEHGRGFDVGFKRAIDLIESSHAGAPEKRAARRKGATV